MNPDTLWSGAEIEKALRSRTADVWLADGVSIDSRTLNRGDLFIALKGPTFDGHDYVLHAFENGAAAAIVSRRPEGLPKDARILLVPDTVAALDALARFARARASARIVAVTGSVGKSGTKEMIRLALASAGPAFASGGSLNNHIGVPLSLARLPRNARYGVFELGMNHAGEISALSAIVRPHVGVITTVEAVHLEAFDSIEGIADAKAELFDGMIWNGYAVLNRDNAYYEHLVRRARLYGIRRFVTFGACAHADIRLLGYAPDDEGARIEALAGEHHLDYRLNLAGQHWALNSLAALAVAQVLGIPAGPAAAALEAMRPMKGRGARHWVELADGPLLVIDESYNASPASMRASLAALGAVRPKERKIAILGDMLELGPGAPALHADLADAVRNAGTDLVFAAGPLMTNLFAALPKSLRGAHAATASQLVRPVTEAVRAGDAVMIKGSAGSRMGLVVEALFALDESGRRRAANGV